MVYQRPGTAGERLNLLVPTWHHSQKLSKFPHITESLFFPFLPRSSQRDFTEDTEVYNPKTQTHRISTQRTQRFREERRGN